MFKTFAAATMAAVSYGAAWTEATIKDMSCADLAAGLNKSDNGCIFMDCVGEIATQADYTAEKQAKITECGSTGKPAICAKATEAMDTACKTEKEKCANVANMLAYADANIKAFDEKCKATECTDFKKGTTGFKVEVEAAETKCKADGHDTGSVASDSGLKITAFAAVISVGAALF